MTKSVALCTYNGNKFLKEQLDSILAQNLPVDEIVICDDGSTDGTLLILKDYKNKFPELFHVIVNPENLGYVKNFEKALSLCTSDLIFLCDQDDIWHKDKVGHIVQYFSENQSISAVAHDLNLIGSYKGNKTFWELIKFGSVEQKFSSPQLLEYLLFNGNVFPGMSHDYEIIIKALRDQKFDLIKDPLGSYRQHDDQSIGYKEKQNARSNTLAEIHLMFQQYLRIKNYSKAFKLNQNISVNFQTKIKSKYYIFLKQFPFIQRLFIHLKIKYYYKIIHF